MWTPRRRLCWLSFRRLPVGDPTKKVSDTARKAIAWALAEYNLTALHERQADKALAAEVDGRSIADRLDDGAAAEELALWLTGAVPEHDTYLDHRRGVTEWLTFTGDRYEPLAEVRPDLADLLDRLVRGDSSEGATG